MLIQRGSREEAIEALINTYLKDPTPRCGWCGTVFDGSRCCEQPYIATNAEIMRQFHAELKLRRLDQKNKFASTDSKNLRVKLTFPPMLLEFLTASFTKLYNEDLFSKEYDTTWFAKHFGKYFAVAEEI